MRDQSGTTEGLTPNPVAQPDAQIIDPEIVLGELETLVRRHPETAPLVAAALWACLDLIRSLEDDYALLDQYRAS